MISREEKGYKWVCTHIHGDPVRPQNHSSRIYKSHATKGFILQKKKEDSNMQFAHCDSKLNRSGF